MPLNYSPGDFDGANLTEGYENDGDDGFSDSVERIETFTAPFMEPGEYWQITAKLTLSTDPGEVVFLEMREEGDGDIISRSVIDALGIPETELTVTLPAYIAAGEFSGPASSGTSPEIYVNNVAGETFNYFVDVQSIRLRDGLETGSLYRHDSESFDTGGPTS